MPAPAWGVALLAAGLAAAGCAPAPPPPEPAGRAARIVSLDYCADQYLLALVGRERILALSPDATASFSYLRSRAAGLPSVRPRAEDVLVLRPDLVVRTYGGGAGAAAFLRRAGVEVLQIDFADDLDAVRDTLRTAARALDASERAGALIAAMDARLEAVRRPAQPPSALYVTPSGYAAGPGTLVHELLEAAGASNFVTAPGYRPLPLERLAHARPDLVAFASFGERVAYNRAWTPLRHPVARRSLAGARTVHLDGATTSCGGWFVAEAVAALAAAARD